MTLPAGSRPPGTGRAGTAIRDRAVTGLLVAALSLAAIAIAAPRAPGSAGGGSPTPSEAPSASAAPPAVYREGVVGRPSSVTPLTAHTVADRTLVGLVFSGLVGLGPGDTLVPDLAASWTVDQGGRVWTVEIRPDASWQDGQPVTADDVVYTVSALKDPSAVGGLAASWADVTVEALGPKTVRFTLGTPVGGFLGALTQPLLPAHLLGDVPMSDLAGSAFASSPVGSGPFILSQLDATRAVLVRSATAAATGPAASPSGPPPASPGPSPATSSAAPASSPAPAAPTPASASPRATPSAGAAAAPSPSPSATPVSTAVADPSGRPIERIEITFFDTEAALSSAFAAGQIDAAADLSAAATQALGRGAATSVLDYPTTTLTAVLLNLRPTHPELRDPNVRKALLGAVDRAQIAASVLGGQARVANALVPPESWAYDAAKVVPVAYDRAASAKLLKGAGWTSVAGRWRAPKAKAPYAITLLTVPPEVNPRLAAVAEVVARAWTALGLATTVAHLAATDLAARLQDGDFAAAVLDVVSGPEPDLYPLLGSSQVRANGSNRSGYQDPGLDKLLEAARKYGPPESRRAAWSALLGDLSARLPVLPIAWADEEVVVRGLSGATPRPIVRTGDRFWDVLAWRLAATR